MDATNIAEHQRGHLVGAPERAGEHVIADLLITNPELIAKIRDGKMQLSNGYEARVVRRAGVTADGEAYDAVQEFNRGNHTAIVDAARGGPTCRLLFDAATEDTMENTPIPPKVDALAQLQAKVDVLEAQLAGVDARIDARAHLVALARSLCPQFVTDGQTDLQIQRAVIKAAMPTLAAKADASESADYVAALYDAAIEAHRKRVDSTRELERTIDVAQGDVVSLDDLEKARTGYVDRLRNASRKAG